MTEAEWLACADPQPMLLFHSVNASGRKLRLFAVACCRRQVVHLLSYPDTRRIPEIAERLADGQASDAELESFGTKQSWIDVPSLHVLLPDAAQAGLLTAYYSQGAVRERSGPGYRLAVSLEQVAQATLFRDIFGNPFRPVALDPRYLTAAAVDLARTMYDARDFGAMPILADALEEAGCDDAELLAHCRGPGPHVRGCWVVDLITGRS